MIYYCIGDVHGMDDLLEEVHALIFKDMEERGQEGTFVHLGDLMDRGPSSKQVLDRVISLSKTHKVINLRGNHEDMFLMALTADRRPFMQNGGQETLNSYGGESGIPEEHFHYLEEKNLPDIYVDHQDKLIFVHAGINPKTYPNDTFEEHIWTRSEKFFDPGRWPDNPALNGYMVIHGHTPMGDLKPRLTPRRINVDTGACMGGVLTCAVMVDGKFDKFIQSGPSEYNYFELVSGKKMVIKNGVYRLVDC
jgi:serine/threonine protein phosphatase 1